MTKAPFSSGTRTIIDKKRTKAQFLLDNEIDCCILQILNRMLVQSSCIYTGAALSAMAIFFLTLKCPIVFCKLTESPYSILLDPRSDSSVRVHPMAIFSQHWEALLAVDQYDSKS
jgi:hypothetical protein